MNSMAIPLCIHISYRDCKKPWSTRIYPLTMGVVIIHVWFSHYRSSPVSRPSTYNGRPDTPITGKSQGHWENHWGTTKLVRRVWTKNCNANCQRKKKANKSSRPLKLSLPCAEPAEAEQSEGSSIWHLHTRHIRCKRTLMCSTGCVSYHSRAEHPPSY